MCLKHQHKHRRGSNSDTSGSTPVRPHLSGSKSVIVDPKPVDPPPATPQLRVSPRFIHAQSDVTKPQSRSKPASKHRSPKNDDPDYNPLSPKNGDPDYRPESSREIVVSCSSSSGTNNIDHSLKSPVRKESKELAALLSGMETPVKVSPNATLDNSVSDDDSISSRTRHRASQSATARLELVKSPNHKYPTRLKSAGHS